MLSLQAKNPQLSHNILDAGMHSCNLSIQYATMDPREQHNYIHVQTYKVLRPQTLILQETTFLLFVLICAKLVI